MLLLMAVKADFGLSGRFQHRIMRHVDLVAVRAGDFIVVVAAAVPGETHAAAVAAETHAVLHADFSF